MTKRKIKVHLINPNKIDHNRSWLYFETDEKARHRFNANIRSGIAEEAVYTISRDYVRLSTHSEWVFYDVHRVMNEKDLYMLVESNNFEDDGPIADTYNKKDLLLKVEKMDCKSDIKHIKKIA